VAFVEEYEPSAGAHPGRRPAFAEKTHPSHGRGRTGGNLRTRQALAACPELDCLRHRLPPGMIAAAEQRAARVGVGADRVLIHNGAISEEAYALALAVSLRATFNSLERVPRAACPLSDEELLEALAAGFLRLQLDGQELLLVSLRGKRARDLTALLRSRPQLAGRYHITSDQCLTRFIMRVAPHAVGRKAAQELRRVRSDLSAAAPSSRLRLAGAGMAAAVLAAVLAAPANAMAAIELALTAVFIAWAGLRLLGALTASVQETELPRLADDKLPVYTIIVALYREAACVGDLVEALLSLDYPREKLDVKFAI